MAYVQRIEVAAGGPAPFPVEIRFSLPGDVTDAQVKKVARRIVNGFEDVYGTGSVRAAGLSEVDMSRELVPPAAPLPVTPTPADNPTP